MLLSQIKKNAVTSFCQITADLLLVLLGCKILIKYLVGWEYTNCQSFLSRTDILVLPKKRRSGLKSKYCMVVFWSASHLLNEK